MKRVWFFVAAISLVPLSTAWLTDSVTLEGERTIYTAECEGGNWSTGPVPTCSGTLVAGERFRFRALRAHSEVLFWTVGDSRRPSGKFTGCTVVDSRNWSCSGNEQSGDTITHQMQVGSPLPDSSGRTRTFHAVEKWRWLMLRGFAPTAKADAKP